MKIYYILKTTNKKVKTKQNIQKISNYLKSKQKYFFKTLILKK